MLGNTEGISFMLKMMKTIDMNKAEFTQTTNSTFFVHNPCTAAYQKE